MEINENEDILLKNGAIIPERELWLLKDPKAFISLYKGLKDAKENKLHVMDLNP